jgi:glycosyltransferase involved in cell wall biosynthesis
MKRIFMLIPDYTACGYYRAIMPAVHCAEQLKAEGIELVASPNLDIREQYDAYILHRFPTVKFCAHLSELKKRAKIVWELDDDLWQLPAWNPASGEVTAVDLENLDAALDLSDFIIVSTMPLLKVVGEQRPCVVCPNLIDCNWFPPDVPDWDRKPRVLWTGSKSHVMDAGCPSLDTAIAANAGRIRLSTFGCWAKFALAHEHIDPVPFTDYFAKLGEIRPHIGICPLFHCRFNHCKSNLKYLELAAGGACVIAQDMAPYDLIDHGETGLLAQYDWEWQLSFLLDCPKDAREIAAAGQEYVRREWSWQSGKGKDVWLDTFRMIAA